MYDAYAYAMMYEYAMFLWRSLARENKSRTTAREYKEFRSLGIMTKDDLRITWQENNFAGE